VPGGLLTDLYELNMAASYLRRGMTADATFSLYARTMPPQRGFLIAAGLEECLDALETFSFEEEDLAFLATQGFDRRALDAFRDLRFEGEVWAVPEGRIVFADEPLLEVTAPIAVAQLLETILLNRITVHRLVAGEADLVDFAFRRTHGIDAAMAVARDSAIVGFVATSNVEAARRYGLTASGTMAHSYIQSFDSEAEAFRAFAEDFPRRTTFLVDTYDTEGGVRAAIETIKRLNISRGLAVRLDSGDLGMLSRRTREMLDDADLTQVRIVASGGLDELEVADLLEGGAPIDAFGIGTQLGVSADAPALDSVYKLTEYDGRPVLKLSEGKATAPGRKQIFRSAVGDLLGLRDEALEGEPLLEHVMTAGRRRSEPSSIDELRARFDADLAGLADTERRLRDPEPRIAEHSIALRSLTAQARSAAVRRSGASSPA
jgi:nicotinate phosphoribosyltransferase